MQSGTREMVTHARSPGDEKLYTNHCLGNKHDYSEQPLVVSVVVIAVIVVTSMPPSGAQNGASHDLRTMR
jgi:hypothetical protein